MELKHQVKAEPGGEQFLSGEMEFHPQDLDVQIKEEPVDFLDSSCDKFDASQNFQQFDEMVNPSVRNSSDVILTSITNPESASLTVPAQVISDPTVITSKIETNNSVLSPSRKKELSNKFFSLETSEKEFLRIPVTVSNFAPLFNNLNHSAELKSTITDKIGEHVPPAGSQGLVQSISPPRQVPAVSNLGQIPTLSTLGVTMSRQVPAVNKDTEEQGVTLLGLLPPAKVSTKMSAALKSNQYHSCDPSSNNVQPVKSTSSCSPNIQPVSPVLPFGATTLPISTPWQSVASTDRKLPNSGTGTHGQNRMPNIFYERQSNFTGQNQSENQELGKQAQSWNYPNSKLQQGGNNSKYVSQGQAGIVKGNIGPSEPKKAKQCMPSFEPGQGFLGGPTFFFGGSDGNENEDDKPLGNIDSNSDMSEFIKNIVEAGKCLQLLNYRVS